ncbi:peptidoglycan DD-metalloendopeptidase family protein [Candidatus Peribacteria bacterium]|jgi:murein DD-endopeptidase MepM/ murein hydrolase activator NlpD|nr:peptidoglycan DD-metalloendopeptidase family protein [Candidatus Peribacteria bacterium]MBT4021429.1 peptidoglycan DD-metalloendopeptidase family protein [Candidatus Peribacteria bacterium]MBT4240445.1 peptidoglycan DD-metalloendopeptidase family protein [Candidatus Peribacteria bacterium]MBT4474527.1 peptidoglycan DD-metalloendopeptidase family protein [Candidatus Peribacteria bacterium]
MHKVLAIFLASAIFGSQPIGNAMGGPGDFDFDVISVGSRVEVEAYRNIKPIVKKYEREMEIRKQEIMDMHLKSLKEEERQVRRQRAALRIMLMLVERKEAEYGPDKRYEVFEKKLKELRGVSDEIRNARERLLSMKKDENEYKRMLLKEYVSDRERNIVPVNTNISKEDIDTVLMWPVESEYEISASFLDESYEKMFGMEHSAIDIPVEQGSDVVAADDGVVLEVNDGGYGYSTVSISHDDHLVTVYGHVSDILVEEGEEVSRGEVIALSGGRPGSKGAGVFTTGPHLHFETRVFGEAVDPMYYLP